MDRFAHLQPTSHHLTNGGQGSVEVVQDPSGQLLVKKTMEATSGTEQRTQALVTLGQQISSPYIAMPQAWRKTTDGTVDGKVESLAPFVEGVGLEDDPPRSLPELLEIALHGVSQWVLLENLGLAHGDIAPGNILISPDGATHWIDLDGANLPDPHIPPPQTIGQRPMLAPELRDGSQGPDLASDRYSMAVYLNMLLLCRHPVDGLASTPAETDDWMSRDLWPERQRSPESDETPIEALGPTLMDLFDRAFSTHRQGRPSAKEWQLALTQALDTTWVHDCGGAFVGEDPYTLTCPHCGVQGARPPEQIPAANANVNLPSNVPASAPSPSAGAAGQSIQVRLTLPDQGIEETLTLTPPQVLILGRDTIPHLPQTISGKHLHLAWIRHQLTIQHVGRHQSLIDLNGAYVPFTLVTLQPGAIAHLQLADVRAMVEIL